MILSETSPERAFYLELFNGCHEMLSSMRTESDVKAEGPHRVVVTARFATGSVWSKTLVIPQSSEQR